MKILLTNDDGIDAPGIEAMYDALQGLGQTIVIAPASVQSASSHGITFHEPLMCDEVVINDRMKGYAVEGRPADCTKVALRAIWPELFGTSAQPDLTVSGLNSGANVGINIIYSGTVAAAVESAFLGVPAIAASLHLGGDRANVSYRRAAQLARHAIDRILDSVDGRLDPHTVMNVNIPRTDDDDSPIPPMRVVEMNTAPGTDRYEHRVSPYGRNYYWASGDGMQFTHTAPRSDVEALLERCITVTPLSFDMTDHARLRAWAERLRAKGGPQPPTPVESEVSAEFIE